MDEKRKSWPCGGTDMYMETVIAAAVFAPAFAAVAVYKAYMVYVHCRAHYRRRFDRSASVRIA
jgi:hypothetical protein